jgi:hypothetical protein
MQEELAAPPAPKSQGRLLYVLSGIAAALAVLIVIAVGLASLLTGQTTNPGPQQVKTGPHIIKLQTGAGFDQQKARVQSESGTFNVGQPVFVVFTVVNQNPNAKIVLKLFSGSTLKLTSAPLNPEVGTTVYANDAIVHQAGQYHWEIDYNGVAEASISFTVS